MCIFLINQLYNTSIIVLLATPQGSTTIATAGSTLSKYLVSILNVRTQHYHLEHLVYIFLKNDYH